jgi:hypothetical protein
MNRPVVRVESPFESSAIIAEINRHFSAGAYSVEVDLCALNIDDAETEDLMLLFEAEFAMGGHDLAIKVAPEQKSNRLIKLLSNCDVLTEVVVKGPSAAAESLVRLLKDKLYITMPIRMEIV